MEASILLGSVSTVASSFVELHLKWRAVVFRSGCKEGYKVWSEFLWIPVISVAPERRPKLTSNGEDYSFDEEKELMR